MISTGLILFILGCIGENAYPTPPSWRPWKLGHWLICLTVLGGFALMVLGVIVFAWRYLP